MVVERGHPPCRGACAKAICDKIFGPDSGYINGPAGPNMLNKHGPTGPTVTT